MTWDPSSDFTIFDGAETVTYRQPGCPAVAVTGVLREQLATGEAKLGSSVGLQPTDTPFNFPGPEMNGLTPAPGDTFTDGAEIGWTVISVAFDTLTQQYRLVARRQRK